MAKRWLLSESTPFTQFETWHLTYITLSIALDMKTEVSACLKVKDQCNHLTLGHFDWFPFLFKAYLFIQKQCCRASFGSCLRSSVSGDWFLFIFSWEPALWTLMSGDRVVLLSKKSIAIFGNKQWLLSIDMKTKVVQHVPRILIFEFWILNLNFQIFKFFLVPSFCLTFRHFYFDNLAKSQ